MSYTPNLTYDRQRTTSRLLLAMTALFFSSIIALATQAQTITNPSFESGKAGWGDQAMVLPFAAFSGAEADAVAVVDGGVVQHRLQQRVGGLVPGVQYEISFEAMSWSPSATPEEITVKVFVDGQLRGIVSRKGEEGMRTEHVRFTAENVAADIRIEPDRTGQGALLVDDVALTSADRLPGLLAARDRDTELLADGDNTHVRLPCPQGEAGMLRVLDHAGRVVRVLNTQGGDATLIDIANLPNGRYHVQNACSGAVLGRFVKL